MEMRTVPKVCHGTSENTHSWQQVTRIVRKESADCPLFGVVLGWFSDSAWRNLALEQSWSQTCSFSKFIGKGWGLK